MNDEVNIKGLSWDSDEQQSLVNTKQKQPTQPYTQVEQPTQTQQQPKHSKTFQSDFIVQDQTTKNKKSILKPLLILLLIVALIAVIVVFGIKLKKQNAEISSLETTKIDLEYLNKIKFNNIETLEEVSSVANEIVNECTFIDGTMHIDDIAKVLKESEYLHSDLSDYGYEKLYEYLSGVCERQGYKMEILNDNGHSMTVNEFVEAISDRVEKLKE